MKVLDLDITQSVYLILLQNLQVFHHFLINPLYKIVNGSEKEMGWYFPRIFDVSTVDKFIGTVTDICRSTTMQRQQNEADVVMQLIKKLMFPLFGKATMEKNKRYVRSDHA